MADDTFVAAILPRYLALNPGKAAIVANVSPATLAGVLRPWLASAQGQRAILAAEIARALEGTEGDGSG